MKDQDVLGSHIQVREHFEHRLAVAAGSDEEISPRGSLDAGRVTPGDADARVLHGVQGVGMLDVVLIRAFGPAGRPHTIIVLQPRPLLYYTRRRCEDRGMEILALAIASLSLLVAIVGTYLANARAKEALDLSRSTAVDTQWSAAQAAVQHLIGFDPSAEPIKGGSAGVTGDRHARVLHNYSDFT